MTTAITPRISCVKLSLPPQQKLVILYIYIIQLSYIEAANIIYHTTKLHKLWLNTKHKTVLDLNKSPSTVCVVVLYIYWIMKVLCVVCEASEAMVWCYADEAPLCNDCDKKVHSSNKLASRHRRVPLMQTRPVPKCDICQVNRIIIWI